MAKLNWNHQADEHIFAIEQGKAVIREEKTPEGILYKPYIEDNKGNVVARFEPGFDDFETADAFVSANLIELDRIGIDQTAFREKLVSTLSVCSNLLPQPDRVFHRWRLENLQLWLMRQPSVQVKPEALSTDWNNYPFVWQQNDDSFQCDTPPHGRAVISKSPNKSTSYIRIEDRTGVILSDYFTPSADFSKAEARLREILSELEEPFIDEAYLDQLIFTLQICERVLPTDTDPMWFVRLNYLETLLTEVLP